MSDAISPLKLVKIIKSHPGDSKESIDATSALQEFYSYGNCIPIALALHRKFGYEIAVVVGCDPDGTMDGIGHSWVIDGNGKAIDIMGYYDVWNNSELTGFGDDVIRDLDESKFKELLYRLPATQRRLDRYYLTMKSDMADLEEEIAEASLVIEQYLIPLITP